MQIFGFFPTICYNILNMHFMKHSLIYTLLVLMVQWVFVQVFADNVLTSPWFTIPLSDLDPVNSGTSVATWTQSLLDLLTKISGLLLFAVPLIAGVSFVFAGYYYVLSAWDAEKASKAKTIIKWNLVAITIAIFSYSIIRLLAALLWGDIR